MTQLAELYVFLNKNEKVLGVYEDDELSEYFNFYSAELLHDIERDKPLLETLKLYEQNLITVSTFHDKEVIRPDVDISDFIHAYNNIIKELEEDEQMHYEVIQLPEENIDDAIRYIFDFGLKKYKDNPETNPIPKVEMVWHRCGKETIVKKVEKSEIDTLIEFIIENEVKRLFDEYCTNEIVYEKANYLQRLLNYRPEEREIFLDAIDDLYFLQEVALNYLH